jgi:hypothetical protein
MKVTCPPLIINMYKHKLKNTQNVTNENAYFRFFGANGKWKWQTSVCSVQTETGNGKHKFVFCGRQTINGNRRLLFWKGAHLCVKV